MRPAAPGLASRAIRPSLRFVGFASSIALLACGASADETVGSPAGRSGRAGTGGVVAGGQTGTPLPGGAAGNTAGSSGASGTTSTNAGGAEAKAGQGGTGGTSGQAGQGGQAATGGQAGTGGAGVPDPPPPPPGPPKGKGTIGYWCGPPAAFQTAAVYDDIAAAGFTLTSNACDGATYNPAYNQQMLAFAAARGLTSIVTDQRVANAVGQARDGQQTELAASLDGAVADYKAFPALAGYHVVDEPNASLFPALGQVVSGLATRDPSRIAYLNLLPTYASPAQLGAPSYDAYVADYLAKVAPPIVSWDYYPFLTSSDLGGFFENMAIVRAHALAAKRPFWQFVQSISFNAHRATTAAEKRWEAMQSLAYGATGVWYFTYWTPPQTAENFGNGIIDGAGNKTAQYDEVKAINTRFAALSSYLEPATSKGVFHNGPLALGTGPRVPGSPVYLPSFAPITVGTFEAGGHAYALLANRDYTSVVESDVVFGASGAAPEMLDVPTGAFVPFAVSASAVGARGHVVLEPGDAILLHLVGALPAGPPGAEAMVGLVRGDAGTLYEVDSAFGVGALRGAGWDDCPTGYTNVGKSFASNGFWLCARDDLAASTFYVGSVLADAGTLYEVSGGVANAIGPGGWDQCPAGTSLGKRFESNGFWLCH